MPKRITQGSQRITLPKRNISTSPDGSLASGMGMNVPSIGNTPGIMPGLAALAASQQMQSRSIPQRTVNSMGMISYGNPFSAYQYRPPVPLVNAGRGNVPGVPFYTPVVQPKDTSTLFQEQTPDNRIQAMGVQYKDYTSNINARLQSVIMEGARPNVLTMADAIRLSPGLSVDDVRSSFAEMGYEFVPTSQGGILRNVGEQEGAIGNSPGSGYTWSNGAWHAPAGQDPYSDIKSVYYSKNRGYVTPEVANLLNKRKHLRTEARRQRDIRLGKNNPAPQQGQNTTAEGLVTLRASFG